MSKTFRNILTFTFLSICFMELYNLWSMYAFGVISFPFYLNIFCTIILPYLFIIGSTYLFFINYKRRKIISHNRIYLILLIYLFVNISRSFFVAANYFDWKSLLFSYIPICVMSTAIFIGSNLIALGRIFTLYIKFLVPVTLVFTLLTYDVTPDSLAFVIVEIYFLLLCFPYMKKKWVFTILFLIILSIIVSPDYRTNLIYAIVSVLILVSYYLNVFKTNLLFFVHRIFFFIPIFFLILAVSGVFNILKIQEEFNIGPIEIKSNYSQGVENLLSDTRTEIYSDILSDLKKNHKIIFGKGGSRGYISSHYQRINYVTFERYSCESGIATIFLKEGIFGAIIYSLIFFYSSKLSILKSKNALSKMLGIFILFKWNYLFVGESLWLSYSSWMLWILVGLGLSKEFRNLSDLEIKIWVTNIFEPKYFYKEQTKVLPLKNLKI